MLFRSLDRVTLISLWRYLFKCKLPLLLNLDDPTELLLECKTSVQLVKALAFAVENKFESFLSAISKKSACIYLLFFHRLKDSFHFRGATETRAAPIED